MGRLWQTLILSKWKPLLAYLPVETVIRDRQEEYYGVLAQADKLGNATPFIEAMLGMLCSAIQEAVANDQVTDQVTDQVKSLLEVLEREVAGAAEIMAKLGLSHRATFRTNYLDPALEGQFIERLQPNSPRSPTQRYRITDRGRGMLARWRERDGGKAAST
jgi:Fic family protein